MIEPRLTSEFRISALRRLAEDRGDFATVLRKGDATSGTILLIGQIKGQNPVLFEQFRSLDGHAIWQPVTRAITEHDDQMASYWYKRAAHDPDLWVVELDVASTERLNELLGTLS